MRRIPFIGRLDDACKLDSNVHGHAAIATSASPETYEFLEVEGFRYAIRLPANRGLRDRIALLLERPVGRPPNDVRHNYASFSYQAETRETTRRVAAKVEHRSSTTVREKSIKIGARAAKYSRYDMFQLSQVAIPRTLVAGILRLIDQLWPASLPHDEP